VVHVTHLTSLGVSATLRAGELRAICGGGRYDKLLSALVRGTLWLRLCGPEWLVIKCCF
jgi:hypothetical protein